MCTLCSTPPNACSVEIKSWRRLIPFPREDWKDFALKVQLLKGWDMCRCKDSSCLTTRAGFLQDAVPTIQALHRKRTLSLEAQLLEIGVCYKVRGFYHRQELAPARLSWYSRPPRNRSKQEDEKYVKEKDGLTWIQMVHASILPQQLKLHPELISPSPKILSLPPPPPLYQSCQSSSSAFFAFHPVHLHITSAAQFWRMNWSDKGWWLITPRWDRDASLLYNYYTVELEQYRHTCVLSYHLKFCKSPVFRNWILIDVESGDI